MNHFDPDPLKQFDHWWKEALASEEPQPEAVALASSTKDGTPSLRMVLFKGMLRDAFSFYTNYHSAKSRELTDNPQAAIVFYWYTLQRQVRVAGTVERTTRAESEAYFNSRPRGSRLAAIASAQSEAIADRATLEKRYAELERQFADREVSCPPNWGGFRLVPKTMEFWAGMPNRLHERYLYRRSSANPSEWTRSMIQP